MSANGEFPRRWSRQDVRHGLAQGIVRLRQRKGWSQEVLAKRLAVTRHRLGKGERGTSPPHPEDLVALLEVFEVTFEELVWGRPAPVAPLAPAQRQEMAMHLNGLVRLVKPMLDRSQAGKRGEESKETAFGAMEAPSFERR
jgi:transcriptional regulator with XRE-family HTH domain